MNNENTLQNKNNGNTLQHKNNRNKLQNNNRYIKKISNILPNKKISNILPNGVNITNIKLNIIGPEISINLPPKSCSYGICSNIYTGKSNFKNFLSFLNYYGELNKNIYVVSHSHAMQHFLEEVQINIQKLTDQNLTDQNLWSIVLNTNKNTTITLTRHAFSIANVAKAKSKAQIKINQISEKDSALSMYGILSAYKKQMKNTENKKNTESVTTIYVSPLIRTWMTGVCLYLKECQENEFTIVISPYIVEDGGALDNSPRQFPDQKQYFEIFLNILQKINNKEKLIKSYESKIINVYDGRSNKWCTFKYQNEKWTGSILDRKPYFGESTSTAKSLSTTFKKLLPGVNKPNKNALEQVSRWCEPLAMKGIFNYSDRRESICKRRLNESEKVNQVNLIEKN